MGKITVAIETDDNLWIYEMDEVSDHILPKMKPVKVIEPSSVVVNSNLDAVEVLKTKVVPGRQFVLEVNMPVTNVLTVTHKNLDTGNVMSYTVPK